MQTIPLGDTGVEVSEFCLGAMMFGSRDDRATSYRMLDMYTAAGGAFIDTANAYARWVDGCQGGESEALLGDWLRERGHRNAHVHCDEGRRACAGRWPGHGAAKRNRSSARRREPAPPGDRNHRPVLRASR
jgi:hypothetical protein